jgi:hypothetical protein
MSAPRRTAVPGVPPGLAGAVRSVLTEARTPVRRRNLLEELERRGHRVSLAGLNRVLQQLGDAGVTVEGPDGVGIKERLP